MQRDVGCDAISLSTQHARRLSVKRSSERILTTHTGSLARPVDLLETMRAKLNGGVYDAAKYAGGVRAAVADIVSKQVENGIDVVNDGEQSKGGFFVYVRERLGGFEPANDAPPGRGMQWVKEISAFPEYYERYFSQNMRGVGPTTPLVCTGPVTYVGQEAVKADIENLKAGLAGLAPEEVFMSASAPREMGRNAYYKTTEEYVGAVAEAMRTEYLAITDAGFLLQIDDPALTDFYSSDPDLALDERRRIAEMHIEAINHAIRGIPRERVRLHTCYGINHGPRIFDTPLEDVVDLMLKVNAGAYSFEAANPRHEHEWRVWQDRKLEDGTVLIPGVITHASNIVEHPEWIAERLVRYARLVGRENVIAGTDCGFSSQATPVPEIHPSVVWAKFQAMAEGARLATSQLW
jgi:5-methyltetrahydropteroyltriglutamate--homocysteine methyltransferase